MHLRFFNKYCFQRYNTSDLYTAWGLLTDAALECGGAANEAFTFDLVDVGREYVL